MDDKEKNSLILEGLIQGLESDWKAIHAMARAMPIGPTEQESLGKIGNHLRSVAGSLKAIMLELSKGGQ
jgi:hypothetical protein